MVQAEGQFLATAGFEISSRQKRSSSPADLTADCQYAALVRCSKQC
jgi:hypothetical protein